MTAKVANLTVEVEIDKENLTKHVETCILEHSMEAWEVYHSLARHISRFVRIGEVKNAPKAPGEEESS